MLLSCGDALIDLLPVSATDGRDALVPVVGGSCLNIAIGMARLGAPTGFVGGISTDLFGRMIADHALASGVDLRHAVRSDYQTTLAFVRMIGGEPHYAFYDAQTASQNWRYQPGGIAFDQLDAVHLGSTTLVGEHGATEALMLARDARGRATVSFDPNCRPSLVSDKARYLATMQAFIAGADIVRMSDVDFDFLYGGDAFEGRASAMLAAGASLVVVTQGTRGARAWHRTAGAVEVGAPQVKVADTIGAGDSFQAALLFALRAIGRIRPQSLADTTADELRRALAFAAACAAFTCSRPGADPPWHSELDANVLAALTNPSLPA